MTTDRRHLLSYVIESVQHVVVHKTSKCRVLLILTNTACTYEMSESVCTLTNTCCSDHSNLQHRKIKKEYKYKDIILAKYSIHTYLYTILTILNYCLKVWRTCDTQFVISLNLDLHLIFVSSLRLTQIHWSIHFNTYVPEALLAVWLHL
jgi:hypothetical protein